MGLFLSLELKRYVNVIVEPGIISLLTVVYFLIYLFYYRNQRGIPEDSSSRKEFAHMGKFLVVVILCLSVIDFQKIAGAGCTMSSS